MCENNYISRELYEADKRAAIAKHESIAADIRTEGARMKGDYNLLNERINNVEKRLDEGLSNMEKRLNEGLNSVKESLEKFISRAGIILTGMTLLFTILQVSFAVIALTR